jgi:hypothetical protein
MDASKFRTINDVTDSQGNQFYLDDEVEMHVSFPRTVGEETDGVQPHDIHGRIAGFVSADMALVQWDGEAEPSAECTSRLKVLSRVVK